MEGKAATLTDAQQRTAAAGFAAEWKDRWNEAVPKEKLNYIMSDPPFAG
ncbi:MAG: hypothetical protein J6S58_01425 [Lentisphaeria bacterium]|nr:hypothetical protein [Lentisphaeria bacterium]